MKPPRLLAACLASLFTSLLALAAAADSPSSTLAPLQAFQSRPYNGQPIAGFPENFACAVLPKAAPGKPTKAIAFAYSPTQKVWLEVQPAAPWTLASVREALAVSEARYAVEESVRQREQEELRQQQAQDQAAAADRHYNTWRKRMASQPSGAGLAALIAQAHQPIVITTTVVHQSPPPPPPNPNCPIVQARNRNLGLGPKPSGLVSATVTPRK